jgi:hypothetical protein
MAPNLNITNEDFEVGEFSLPQEEASPRALPMPQFLYDDVSGDCVSAAAGEVSAARGEVSGEASSEELEAFDRNMEISLDQDRPRPTRQSPNPWPPQLTLDLALGMESLEDILASHGLSQAHYDRLITVPSFRRELAVAMREMRENGVSFARKAAAQAESYLFNVDDIVHDMDVPASTRLAAIQSVVKWGRLEPKDEKGQDNGNGTTVNLQINFT